MENFSEKKVKERYPKAILKHDIISGNITFEVYRVMNGQEEIGNGTSPYLAWENASKKLKQKQNNNGKG